MTSTTNTTVVNQLETLRSKLAFYKEANRPSHVRDIECKIEELEKSLLLAEYFDVVHQALRERGISDQDIAMIDSDDIAWCWNDDESVDRAVRTLLVTVQSVWGAM